jgi:hypothetical protein
VEVVHHKMQRHHPALLSEVHRLRTVTLVLFCLPLFWVP